MRAITTFLVLSFLSLSIWSQGQSIYVTNTGTKYHKEGCRYLAKSKIEKTVEEAVDQGFSPCSICKPSSDYKTSEKSNQAAPATNSGTTQCTATTQAGNRCKRKTTSGSGKCWQHE